jgi:hypothetical protein
MPKPKVYKAWYKTQGGAWHCATSVLVLAKTVNEARKQIPHHLSKPTLRLRRDSGQTALLAGDFPPGIFEEGRSDE